MDISSRMLLTIGYDGTRFQGWQVQPGALTVQSEIEAAIARLCPGGSPRVHASGRTDTGVHARGQRLHFDSPRPDFRPETWMRALNGMLPHDIRIYHAQSVPAHFHARFDALRKEYRYFIHRGRVLPPEFRLYRFREPRPLDLPLMRQACELLRGEHDFASFSALRGSGDEHTVRTLHELSLHEYDADTLCLHAVANGFLYKMVRQLAGTLLRVGLGKLDLSELRKLLENPFRGSETVSAPPQGLFLWRVTYPEPIE